MGKREWGHLCPDGHGLLTPREEWTAKGVIWCPSAEHSGNGRFYRLNEVAEGWFVPGTRTVSAEYLANQQAAHERSAEWEAERVRRSKERERAMAKEKAAKTTAPKAGATPRDCLCGCGGQTKGGRFLPGHDARFHGRIKTLTGQFGLSHDEAEKIASKGPLTGKYAAKPAAAATAAPKPEAARTRPARTKRAKQPDLTARATDEPVAEEAAEPVAEGQIEV
jgi:hypothetical protein